MARKKLIGLNKKDYEHPFDRQALEKLKGTPGLESLSKKLWEMGLDRIFLIQATGSSLKINNNNFPDAYQIFNEAYEILDMSKKIELYMEWQYAVNGFATGVAQPLIVLNSGCLDLLSSEELSFIIGHEMGHHKSEHILYHQMAEVFPLIGGIIGNLTLGLGGIVSDSLRLALLYWQRMSEFTSDRAGLLACQDLNVAISTMIKMAGLPKKFFDSFKIEDFIKQAKEFENYDFDSWNKLIKIGTLLGRSHPWTVMRASELLKWKESGEYQRIIDECTTGKKTNKTAEANYCPHCGGKVSTGEKFCGNCGGKI